jgi:hypothetical protein
MQNRRPLIRLISDGGTSDRAASLVYSLANQVLCAKSVPRADVISLCCGRRPLWPGLETKQRALTSSLGRRRSIANKG